MSQPNGGDWPLPVQRVKVTGVFTRFGVNEHEHTGYHQAIKSPQQQPKKNTSWLLSQGRECSYPAGIWVKERPVNQDLQRQFTNQYTLTPKQNETKSIVPSMDTAKGINKIQHKRYKWEIQSQHHTGKLKCSVRSRTEDVHSEHFNSA